MSDARFAALATMRHVQVFPNRYVPDGFVWLWRDAGTFVWKGKLGDPFEDVDCKEALLSPNDFQAFMAARDTDG